MTWQVSGQLETWSSIVLLCSFQTLEMAYEKIRTTAEKSHKMNLNEYNSENNYCTEMNTCSNINAYVDFFCTLQLYYFSPCDVDFSTVNQATAIICLYRANCSKIYIILLHGIKLSADYSSIWYILEGLLLQLGMQNLSCYYVIPSLLIGCVDYIVHMSPSLYVMFTVFMVDISYTVLLSAINYMYPVYSFHL